jgi:hypothetical protein
MPNEYPTEQVHDAKITKIRQNHKKNKPGITVPGPVIYSSGIHYRI